MRSRPELNHSPLLQSYMIITSPAFTENWEKKKRYKLYIYIYKKKKRKRERQKTLLVSKDGLFYKKNLWRTSMAAEKMS
jgi:hypothetical protein